MLRKLVSILTHVCKDYELHESVYVACLLHFLLQACFFKKQEAHITVLLTLVDTKVLGHV